jgi:hypothetical protein
VTAALRDAASVTDLTVVATATDASAARRLLAEAGRTDVALVEVPPPHAAHPAPTASSVTPDTTPAPEVTA